eukprot:2405072-Amphidinium_carterae.1
MEQVCTTCPDGYYNEEAGAAACEACPLGTFRDSLRGCEPCRPGWYQSEEGMACTQCSEGYIAVEHGQSACEACEAGWFQLQVGTTSCTQCPVGTYQNETGAESCTPCPRGSYSQTVGSKFCEDCDMVLKGATTEAERSHHAFLCGCPSGTWDPRAYGSLAESCVPCDEDAMLCPGFAALLCPYGSHIPWSECYMSEDTLAEPVRASRDTVKKGYMSEVLAVEYEDDTSNMSQSGSKLLVTARLDVEKLYQCTSSKPCPGQPTLLPSASPCYGKNIGIACAECPDMYTLNFWDECRSCKEGMAEVLVAVAAIALTTVVISLAYGWNQVSRSDGALMQAVSIPVSYVVIANLQVCGMLSSLQASWPFSLSPLLRACQPLLGDLRMLGMSCMTRTTFANLYIARQMIPVGVMVVMPLMWFISRPVSWAGSGKPQPLRWQAIVNTLGVMSQWGYIALLHTAVIPFMCNRNPNGKYTLAVYSFQECYSDAWHSMLPLAVISVLVFGVGIYAAIAAICVAAPYWMRNLRFRVWTRFLTQQTHPSVWWYHMVLYTKSAVLVLCPVILSDNDGGYKQMMVNAFTMLAGLSLQMSVVPFNTRAANRLEAGSM